MNDHLLGFYSLGDYFKTLFGDPQKTNLKLVAIMTLVLGFVTSFIEQWVWSPLWTLLLLTIVICLDFIAAVAKNLDKEGFITNKAIKLPFVLLSYWVFLAIAYNLPALNKELGIEGIGHDVFNIFSKSFYWLCLIINLQSLLHHASSLGLLPKPIANFVLKWIDRHKVVIEDKSLNSLSQEAEQDRQEWLSKEK